MKLALLLAAWLAAWSLVTMLVFGWDKRQARHGGFRVPERTLFGLALLGGGAGAVIGMRLFHHKTKHWYFAWGMPCIAAAQLALGVWLWLRYGRM